MSKNVNTDILFDIEEKINILELILNNVSAQ